MPPAVDFENFAVLFVYDGSAWQVASTPVYASTTTIGNPAAQNVYIDGQGVAMRNGTTEYSTYGPDDIHLGLNASIRFSANTNSLQPENNLRTFNYDVGGYTTLYLPWDIRLESDITWSTNSGYSDGYKQNEVLWNAALSKSFLRGNQGTLRFKIYDILQQRSNISRTVSSTMIADRQYNTLSSYFMVHFIYRFSIFKGGATTSDTPYNAPQDRKRGSRPPRI